MGDFINFLFDRYDRSVVVLSLSWSGGDRARNFVRVPDWSTVNGRLYKFPIRSVRPSVVVLSLSWSGGDRNYTDTTTILNVSAVTVALPLYGE